MSVSHKTVSVTGASGYIGSHVVRVLLEAGHTVRATVRDVGDKKKTEHLKELPGAERLSLFAADLQDEKSFDEPFAGCEWICHMASSVRLSAKDPQSEIVDPAVEGTLNALRAAHRAGTVKRVLVTSSVAAVANSEERSNAMLSEKDWNQTASLKRSPYPLSKVLAERAAWEFVKSLPERRRYRLVTLLPGFVMGPVTARVHLHSSPSFLHMIMLGKIPSLPRFSFSLVDVRDVADAHLKSLESTDADGRYLLVAGNLWIEDMARIVRDHVPDTRTPIKRAPTLLMYLVGLFSKQWSLRYVRNNLGRERFYDSTRAKEQFGLQFVSLEQTIADTARSIRELGAA
jgi:nucleoside-diphosphate-sugar epimerase